MHDDDEQDNPLKATFSFQSEDGTWHDVSSDVRWPELSQNLQDDVVFFPGWFMSYLRGEFEVHMDEWTVNNPPPDLPPDDCVFDDDELAVPIGLN
jgi:hypothetical protein